MVIFDSIIIWVVVLFALFAGWQIGARIHEKFIEPTQEKITKKIDNILTKK